VERRLPKTSLGPTVAQQDKAMDRMKGKTKSVVKPTYLQKVRENYDPDDKLVLQAAKAPKPQDVQSTPMSDGYSPQRQHVTWFEGIKLGLQYRRKKLSDGEARRYFIGYVQVAYVRFHDGGKIMVCGIHQDRAYDREFESEEAAHKYIVAELKGTAV